MFKALFARRAWMAQLRRHCSAIAWAAWSIWAACAATSAWAAPNAQPSQPARPLAPVVLVVGDSISAEYGLRRDTGWVKLLERRLAQDRIAATVVNASISGDTTSGGRSRLPALLAQHHPSHVIIELGANDALRGLPIGQTRDNLTSMARAAKQAGARVMLVGMQVPPNYGQRYTQDFAEVFVDVARAEHVALVPFLLKGVADAPEPLRWFQADRIHPKEAAQPLLLANVWPVLEPLLRPRPARREPVRR